ncbi:hypothetical protein KKC1_26780 [Calderihabitans maritimus]|uniref:Uncharacterized protein n=1 Tax=Calderihabitans maritimus TaxID=1246530 RepID=A0A1Z5HW25_9FIRM|nr:hypothetical protein KKC1_26780 [Calderihabitans maritimus]
MLLERLLGRLPKHSMGRNAYEISRPKCYNSCIAPNPSE